MRPCKLDERQITESLGAAKTITKAEIYTDGGCQGNPGKGAWAAMIYEGSEHREFSGVERDTRTTEWSYEPL